MVHPDDIPRIAPLGMVVDVSPCVAAPMSFHDAYKHYYGEARHETFFPSRALIDGGVDFVKFSSPSATCCGTIGNQFKSGWVLRSVLSWFDAAESLGSQCARFTLPSY